MSKIGQLNIELSEQAYELGFESVQKALDAGYIVYNNELVPDDKEQEIAHQAYLVEKETILNELDMVSQHLEINGGNEAYLSVINDTIDFIKKGEY